MISKEKIQFLVDEILADDMFIVDIAVGSGNAIAVSVDSDSGMSIDKCIGISRHIEHNLDREIEDFSLEVSSPGLSQPLRVLRQYYKNIGRKIEVITKSGVKQEGILKSVDAAGFELEISLNEKIKGTKVQSKSLVGYSFDQIKTVKLLISLK